MRFDADFRFDFVAFDFVVTCLFGVTIVGVELQSVVDSLFLLVLGDVLLVFVIVP